MDSPITKKEIIKRYLLFIISLFFAALGVAFTKSAELGVSPISFLFGYFTDFGMWLVSYIPITSYPIRLIMVFVGVVILGFGVALAVIANVIMNSGEAFVKALADTLKKNFGNVKVIFDISYVTLSVIISMILFGGAIKGTREGTLIAAVCTGLVVKFFTKHLTKKARVG